jgi:hypothetical protein
MEYPQAIQVVDFFEGRKRLPTSLHPNDWHPRASLVYVLSEVEVPEWVIELAREYDYHYNPFTRTFVKI